MDVPLPDDLTPQKPQDRIRAVLRSTLDSESKLVAVALIDRMDKSGESWPDVATLSENTGLSERTIRSVILHGMDTGWLDSRWAAFRTRIFRVEWARLTDCNRAPRTIGARREAR